MTNQDKWNLIVDRYKALYSELEAKVQSEWELYCTELFGYKKILGEIDSQRHLLVGSGNSIIPDIILLIDKKDVFDIELKQYSLLFNETFESQLISYLNQTHLSTGMIVCNKIYLYYYEYATVTINKIEIPFEKDHPDGITLMGLLAKESFSTHSIKSYIEEKHNKEKRLHEIKEMLTNDWIKTTIKNKLMEKYSESEVDLVLSDIFFKSSSIISATSPLCNMHSTNQVVQKYKSSSDLNITAIIQDWCRAKTLEGDLCFLQNYSSKKYTRFTTKYMDTIIPYKNDSKSGWNNGYFYSYEVINYNGSFKMWVVLSNHNAPDDIKATFKRISTVIGKSPKKEDWQWWGIFTANPFHYNDKTTRENIFNELDSQFAQLQAQVSSLLKNL